MPIETAAQVNDLRTDYPLAGDLAGTTDEHLRLIKTVLKASFPNMDTAVDVPQLKTDFDAVKIIVTRLDGKEEGYDAAKALIDGLNLKLVTVSNAAPVAGNVADKTLYLRY